MKHISSLGLVLFAFLSHATAASTVATPKPKGTPVVQGTTQLDGQNARLGQTFTIGKTSPLNFTLLSATYSVGRFEVDNSVWSPKADEKLLVLRFTVQNPQKRDVGYYWGDVKFTAVDAQDRNYEGATAIARPGTTASLQVTLKPAQKVEVTTVVVVPAAGPVPKLIVRRNGESAVLRYALSGQVTPLVSPFADPADASGATASQRVPVTPGTYVPLEQYDVRLDEVRVTSDAIQGKTPAAGYKFLSAVFTLRNPLTRPVNYYWGNFDVSLLDADGDMIKYNQTLLKASKDEVSSGAIGKGEMVRVRFYFEVADGAPGERLLLSDRRGRTYAFDVRSVGSR
ncbi:hypothetical protein [Deinococcus pimensis]|uniref:hypothetical protein n=1 Tax=Deinococcus pimensis TaxID=309888 RepID=UPI000481C499|nr:hypothetical protein [Deinococcus pimensis]